MLIIRIQVETHCSIKAACANNPNFERCTPYSQGPKKLSLVYLRICFGHEWATKLVSYRHTALSHDSNCS